MNREKINSNLLLLLTSTIWGFGFVAQELGGGHLGPNAFNGTRYTLGAICLMVILFVWHKGRSIEGFRSMDWVKASLSAGCFCFWVRCCSRPVFLMSKREQVKQDLLPDSMWSLYRRWVCSSVSVQIFRRGAVWRWRRLGLWLCRFKANIELTNSGQSLTVI